MRECEESLLPNIRDFLRRKIEYCFYIFSNMDLYGHKLKDHPNSGNIKVLLLEGTIMCVFVLVKRGNILVQSDDILFTKGLSSKAADMVNVEIRKESKERGIKIRGLMGQENFAELILGRMRDFFPNEKGFHSADIVMKFELEQFEEKLESHKDWMRGKKYTFRVLREEELEEAWNLRYQFCEDTGISEQLSKEEWTKHQIENIRDKLFYCILNKIGEIEGTVVINSISDKVMGTIG